MKLGNDAYTPEALMDAGLDYKVVKTLLADGPRAVPERPRTTLTGRGREKEPTTRYVWGPDARVLLAERQP